MASLTPNCSLPKTRAMRWPKLICSRVATCAALLGFALAAVALDAGHTSRPTSAHGGATAAHIVKPRALRTAVRSSSVLWRCTRTHFSPPLQSRPCTDPSATRNSWKSRMPKASHERSTAARLPMERTFSSTQQTPLIRCAAAASSRCTRRESSSPLPLPPAAADDGAAAGGGAQRERRNQLCRASTARTCSRVPMTMPWRSSSSGAETYHARASGSDGAAGGDSPSIIAKQTTFGTYLGTWCRFHAPTEADRQQA